MQPDSRPSLDLIAAAVCDDTGVALHVLRGKRRTVPIPSARYCFAAVAHCVGYSYPEIAQYLCQSSHASVASGAPPYALANRDRIESLLRKRLGWPVGSDFGGRAALTVVVKFPLCAETLNAIAHDAGKAKLTRVDVERWIEQAVRDAIAGTKNRQRVRHTISQYEGAMV